MKYLAACYLLLLIILQTGCTTNVETSKNYQFNPQTKFGLATLTSSCNLGGFNTKIALIKTTGDVPQNDYFSYTYTFDVNCNQTDQDLSPPELKTIALPAGTYYFDSITLRFLNGTGTYTIHPIYFTIYPGQINYLGRMQLIYGYNMQAKIQFINAANEDIPLMKQNINNFNPDYLVQGFVRQGS